MSDWISVKERMPEKRGTYLTFCRFRDGQTEIKVKLWTPTMGFTSQPKAVTHWMPLPEAPDPDDAPLTWADLMAASLIGEPIWDATQARWVLIADSALDSRSWLDFVDHAGKITRFDEHAAAKHRFYRRKS